MKKKILYSLVSTGVLLLAGCNETWNPGGSGEGSIVPVVTLDTNTASSRSDKGASRSDAKAITVNDLALTLTPMNGNGAAQSWTSIEEFGETRTVKVGAYTLEAKYGDINEQGFEKPFYYGVSQLTVRENETTPVALTAKLGNAMVTLTYTENFSNYFAQNFKTYSLDVNGVSYTADETRPVYVTPGNVQFKVNFVKADGTSGALLLKDKVGNSSGFNLLACHHYHVELDVNNGNVGNAELKITFDDELTQEEVIIDLSQDLEKVPVPTVVASGFESGTPINVISGSDAEEPLKFTVMARGGLEHVYLKTISTALGEKHWPTGDEIDLVNIAEAYKANMQALGFTEIGLWKNPDQMAVLDFSGVIPYIRYIEGTTNETTFVVTVVDRLGQTSEAPVTLAVNIEKLQLAVTENETLPFYESRATFALDYNGADAQNRIGVQYLNNAGAWSNLQVESIVAKSRAVASYTVTVNGLPADAVYGEAPVTLRVVAMDKKGAVAMTSNEYIIERKAVPFSLAISENDVYALRAAGLLAHTEKSVADFVSGSNPVLEMSTDNGTNYSQYNYTVDGDHIKVEGLKSSTTYIARIKADGMNCRPVTFTTEAELSLPNAGMEDWSTIPSANQSSYGVQIPSGWGTMNYRTTSSGGVNAEYVRNNGTKPTNESVSGNAALIRTVGWGNGNTAGGSGSIVNHVTQGELYLGNNPSDPNVEPDYLVQFVSRPKSLSFSAKYNVGEKASGDKGYVEFAVYDANGTVISIKTMTIDAVSNYERFELPLSYSYDNAKASYIKVLFRSTSDIATYAVKDKLTLPKFMVGKESVGSSLLIDDITLNY